MPARQPALTLATHVVRWCVGVEYLLNLRTTRSVADPLIRFQSSGVLA